MARERETIDPKGDKRFIRRDAQGRFTSDQSNLGNSLSHDRRVHAKTEAKKGQGDKGDRRTK